MSVSQIIRYTFLLSTSAFLVHAAPEGVEYPDSAVGIVTMPEKPSEIIKDKDLLERFKQFRKEFSPYDIAEFEGDRAKIFESYSNCPLSERLLVFGELSKKGYLSLEPEAVGPFAETASIIPEEFEGSVLTSITAAGRDFLFVPNANGFFPTIHVAPKQDFKIELTFPEHAAGSRLYLGLAGGGQLESGVVKLDENQIARFDFAVNEYAGLYAIDCLIEGKSYALQFNVGGANAHLFELTPKTVKSKPTEAKPITQAE